MQELQELKELEEFISQKYDKYRGEVSPWGSDSNEYTTKMSNASLEIKQHIEKLYPNIIVNDETLHKIQFARNQLHHAWNRQGRLTDAIQRNPLSMSPDLGRGILADEKEQDAKSEFENYCKGLFSCIKIAQKLDGSKVDESVFEELRQQEKLKVYNSETKKYEQKDMISFSNPIMQYAFEKYCKGKQQEEQIQSLGEAIEQRNELIKEDTSIIQELTSIIDKYKRIVENAKKMMGSISKLFGTTTEKVNQIKTSYEDESKKGLFARIGERLKGLLNRNAKLSEGASLNARIAELQEDLKQKEAELSQTAEQTNQNIEDINNPRAFGMVQNRAKLLTRLQTTNQDMAKGAR